MNGAGIRHLDHRSVPARRRSPLHRRGGVSLANCSAPTRRPQSRGGGGRNGPPASALGDVMAGIDRPLPHHVASHSAHPAHTTEPLPLALPLPPLLPRSAASLLLCSPGPSPALRLVGRLCVAICCLIRVSTPRLLAALGILARRCKPHLLRAARATLAPAPARPHHQRTHRLGCCSASAALGLPVVRPPQRRASSQTTAPG